jgi:hypothetical protein
MIGIRIEDENGKLVSSDADIGHLGNIGWLLRSVDVSQTSCLRFIDPYGDTTFNRLQTKVLLDELAAAQELISEDGIQAVVEKKRAQLRQSNIAGEDHWAPTASDLITFTSRLREMIEATTRRPHVYVKFVGD